MEKRIFCPFFLIQIKINIIFLQVTIMLKCHLYLMVQKCNNINIIIFMYE